MPQDEFPRDSQGLIAAAISAAFEAHPPREAPIRAGLRDKDTTITQVDRIRGTQERERNRKESA